MTWAAKWVGVTAPEGAVPCWWLVRLVYQHELKIVLPDDGVFAPKQQWSRLLVKGMASAVWQQLSQPEDFAVALVRVKTEDRRHSPWHIGVIAVDNPIWLLSTVAESAALQRLSLYIDAGIIRGYYAYRPAASGHAPGGSLRSTLMPK